MRCSAHLPYTYHERHLSIEDQTSGMNAFETHFAGRIQIAAGMALFFFNKGGVVQEAIHTMKYRHQPLIGTKMGRVLGRRLAKHPTLVRCTAILPVPLHASKKRKRGYNQSEFIAEGIASVLDVPVLKDVLYRKHKGSTQTRKSRSSRMDNASGLFEIRNAHKVKNQHILLVDDVLTSGATLEYCGRAIQSAGCKELSMATLAMGAVV